MLHTAALCGFSELTKNVIRSSQVTPHLPWKFHANRSSRLLVMFTNVEKDISIAASRGFSELTRNWIWSSHGHSTPSLSISCKSVQPFSRNLANKKTKKDIYKQRNKETNQKQYPAPPDLFTHSLTAARNRLWVVAPSMLTGHQQEPMHQQQWVRCPARYDSSM